ncbi:MAG: c-type cytochrome [Gemmatimonadota bacterium]|nr:c-type cytochrome [Gemmatimonadota bacterium]MDH3422122.1 c-type cytochrome [Gemmatimonadota bacterium]
MSAARLLFLLWAGAGCTSASPAPVEPPPSQTTVAFYTAEQATRGRRVFTTVCSACHGRNEFVGPIFGFTWMADSIGDLFEHISTKMPQDDPGSLSAEEYVAVVAYMLQLNGRAAGDRELPADPAQLATLRW